MRKMKHFQDLGHRVIFLIGDFTGMIGDPTGKSKTRPPLTREEIETNAETYKKQAFKILDPVKTEVRFNSEWLGPLGSDGLRPPRRDLQRGAHARAARLPPALRGRASRSRSTSSSTRSPRPTTRWRSKADVELGGTDQLFNLNVGRDIMPAYGLEPQVVLTTPLLEGTDGVEKMSKSLGNYIGVTEPPDAMYAKLMSISDELMWRYYTLLTDLAPGEIEAERGDGAADGLEDGARAADRRRTSTGPEAAAAAEAEWRRVHQERQAPSELRVVRVAAGAHRPHALLVARRPREVERRGGAPAAPARGAPRRRGARRGRRRACSPRARASCSRSAPRATCGSTPELAPRPTWLDNPVPAATTWWRL